MTFTLPKPPQVYLSKQAQKHPNWTGIKGDILKMIVFNHFDYNSAKTHPFGMFLGLFESSWIGES